MTQIEKDRAEQIGSGSMRKRSDMNEKQKEEKQKRWEEEKRNRVGTSKET